jgi:hypothetical protein
MEYTVRNTAGLPLFVNASPGKTRNVRTPAGKCSALTAISTAGDLAKNESAIDPTTKPSARKSGTNGRCIFKIGRAHV